MSVCLQVSVLPRCTSVSAVLDAHSLSEGSQVAVPSPVSLLVCTKRFLVALAQYSTGDAVKEFTSPRPHILTRQLALAC